jgi:hypothetical protein
LPAVKIVPLPNILLLEPAKILSIAFGYENNMSREFVLIWCSNTKTN